MYLAPVRVRTAAGGVLVSESDETAVIGVIFVRREIHVAGVALHSGSPETALVLL